MNTENNDLEQQLRDVLRQELDDETGPDPTWDESPAAREVAAQDSRKPSRWTLRVLAIAAVITIGGGAVVLLGAPDEPPPSALGPNGWIAYGLGEPDPWSGDLDIGFVAPDQEAMRAIGTETDNVNEACPAFSLDGRQLAYGRVTGHRAEDDEPSTYQDANLVIADVAVDGHVTEQFTIALGDDLPPPCAVWSRSGERIAFGVPRTSPINPTQSAAGSEVWILTLADRSITVLPDLLATDLEWSPDSSILAIASGSDGQGETAADGLIYLYEVASGTTRTLEGTEGALNLTWSPEGGRIAYTASTDDVTPAFVGALALRVIDVITAEQRVLSAGFRAIHGIGPVWSPGGESIVYQACRPDQQDCSGEKHDVIRLWPDDLSADGAPREEIIPLFVRSEDGSERTLYPWSVAWSPDGASLMFFAWSFTDPANEEETLLGTVPATGGPAEILVNDRGLDVKPVYDGGPSVGFQTWGRLIGDAAPPLPTPEESAAEPPSSEPTLGASASEPTASASATSE